MKLTKTQKDFLNTPTNILFLGGAVYSGVVYNTKELALALKGQWDMDGWPSGCQSVYLKTKSKQPRMVKVVSK
jgi:hypothetical protein